MAPRYLSSLDEGGMTREGDPETASDSGAALVWDGHYLPGPWLMRRAITGLYGAPKIAETIRRMAGQRKFDLAMHLGDVYYSGTEEEVDDASCRCGRPTRRR